MPRLAVITAVKVPTSAIRAAMTGVPVPPDKRMTVVIAADCNRLTAAAAAIPASHAHAPCE